MADTPLSVVIYFHSTRIDNLKQMLRLFCKREPDVASYELILVCQDKLEEEVPHKFGKVQVINLNIETYNKAIMCNTGVDAATSDKIALLDSDRVLGKLYFKRHSDKLKEKRIIATWRLLNINHPCTDEEINLGEFTFKEEAKSKTNEIKKKNAFSGNTLILKSDFLALGGMDESMEGYGIVDTEITRKAMDANFEIVWTEKTELHLFHYPTFFYKGKEVGIEEIRKNTNINVEKYEKKYGLK